MAARKGQGAGSTGHEQQQPEIDALFKASPAEFTAARNALAAKLKKDGDAAGADRVKALGKPSISAWLANQLYWRQRKAFDHLMAAGDQFRKAQAAQLAGKQADLRGSLDARREALSELTRHAAEILRETGHPPSPDTMRRVMTTLEALATYGEQPDAPQPGRLTADVDPPGFEALAALVPRSGRRSSAAVEKPRVIPFSQRKPEPPRRKAGDAKEEERRREAERKAQEAEARKALREAERALADARRSAERARAAMKEAAARAKAAEKAKSEVETRFEKLSAAADAARQDARRIASEAEEAAQALDDAERAVQTARAALSVDADL
jgi:hypothetical protein